jgi:hypothetical protein
MHNFHYQRSTCTPLSAIDAPWPICLWNMRFTLVAQRYALLVASARRSASFPHCRCGMARHGHLSVDNDSLPLISIDWA